MKKKIFLMAMIMCVGLSLTGCDIEKTTNEENNTTNNVSENDTKNNNKEEKNITKSTEESNDSIVGKWEYEEGYFTYTFNTDKTGSYDAAGSVLKFTYEINGNEITLTYEDNSTYKTEYKIDGSTLIVKDSGGQEVKYIRK